MNIKRENKTKGIIKCNLQTIYKIKRSNRNNNNNYNNKNNNKNNNSNNNKNK